MNKTHMLPAFLAVQLLVSIGCRTTDPATNASISTSQGDSPTASPATALDKPQWPKLPRAVLSPYVLNTEQLARVPAGDTMALPLAGGFKTLTLAAPLTDGVLAIKDLSLKIKDVNNQNISIVVKSLHTHDPKEKEASFVWGTLTAQADGSPAIELAGVFYGGKLAGYEYVVAVLEELQAGNRIVILDEEGWRVVKITQPVKDGLLEVDGFTVSGKSNRVTRLRIMKTREGMAALIGES